MALISGRGKSEFVDYAEGKVIKYTSRNGIHKNTGKPLSDIIFIEGGKAVNWPKITDKETGEVRPWDYFEGDLDIGMYVHVGWTDGDFDCKIIH